MSYDFLVTFPPPKHDLILKATIQILEEELGEGEAQKRIANVSMHSDIHSRKAVPAFLNSTVGRKEATAAWC